MDRPAILSPGYDPRAAGDAVLATLITVSPPEAKGCHDSDFVIVDGKAYIVFMANPRYLGEQPDWPEVACHLAVVDLETMQVVHREVLAASQQRFANTTLDHGACFVPRLLIKDAQTLRCFFASENPAVRESQTWYRDFDVQAGHFLDELHPAQLQTDHGVFPMQPDHFHRHGVSHGFTRPAVNSGLFLIDSFTSIAGRPHAVLNNFSSGQLALAVLDDRLSRFEVMGDIPGAGLRLSEAAFNCLADGSWLLIARHDGGDGNYRVATSVDGRSWTCPEPVGLVPDGIPSKPTLDRFGEHLYLGWNAAAQVDNANRSTFHLDCTRDGKHWQRRFTFASAQSFQYPVFRSWQDRIYVSVTQGRKSSDHHSGKEMIRFGCVGLISDLDSRLSVPQ